jgi:hypothetical protein
MKCLDKLPIIWVPPCHLPVDDLYYTTILDDNIVRSKVTMGEDSSMLMCINHATDVRTNLAFRFGDIGIDNRSIEVFFAFKRTWMTS